MTRPAKTSASDSVGLAKLRSQSIDILRALAILLVLGRHAPPCPPDTNLLLRTILDDCNRVGWMGVDLFFVLSGFLVSGLLYREFESRGTISGRNFLIRRGFRIYPAYWVFLFGGMALDMARGHYPPLGPALSECFFLQDYLPSLWGHTWSLAVEEQFYFALVLFFLYLVKGRSARNPFDAVPWVFIAVLVSCVAMRLATSYLFPYSFDSSAKPFHLRMDALFCGVFLAYLDHRFSVQFRAWATRWRGALIACGVLLLFLVCCLPLENFYVHTYGFTMTLMAFGLLLCGSLTGSLPNRFAFRCFAYLGENSYSVYLYHMLFSGVGIVLMKQNAFAQAHYWLIFSAYFAGSLLVGIFMARLIEFPMLRLRDRFFPARIRSLNA